MSDDLQDSDVVNVEFDLDSWIDGAQIAQRSVEIYGRPDLIGPLEDIERRIAIAKKAASDDGSLADTEASGLEEQYEEIVGQILASKSTWYLSGLAPERVSDIKAKYPTPELPAKPTPAQIAKFEAAMAEQNLRWIAASVVKIVSSDGRTKTGVTYEQMVKLRERLGDLQIGRLKRTSMAAQIEEPQVPTPFSQQKSGTDPT